MLLQVFASAILFTLVAYPPSFHPLSLSFLAPPAQNPMASLANKLRSVTVSPTAKHTATVIFVHGLGDSGNGIKPIAQLLARDPGLGHIKWIMPDAPLRSITGNMGMTMPGWFDIASFEDFDAEEDEKGLADSADSLDQIIASEVEAGITPNRIVLGGFSQGGTMSLLTGLTKSRKLGGITVLSGWLPLQHKFKEMISGDSLSTPIFWGYGSSDPLVLPEFGKASIEYLVGKLGVKRVSEDDVNGLQAKVYPGLQHGIDPTEIKDWGIWIKKALPS